MRASFELDAEDEQALLAIGTTTDYHKGDIIFSAGMQPTELHYILRGWVNVFKLNDQGKQISVGLRYAGEFAGLGSFVCNHERGCYGQAMMDSTIVTIACAKFDLLLSEHPHFSDKLICLLGSRLKDTQNSMVYFISHQTDKRLMHTLLNIAKFLGREEKDKRLLNLKLTQEELAHLIGCSRQTINNLLTDLRNSGCIEMKGREIIAIVPAQLIKRVSPVHKLNGVTY